VSEREGEEERERERRKRTENLVRSEQADESVVCKSQTYDGLRESCDFPREGLNGVGSDVVA